MESRVFDGAGLVLVLEQTVDIGGQERVVEALLRRYPLARAVAPRFRTTGRPGDPRPWWEQRVELHGRPLRHRRAYRTALYVPRVATIPLDDARVVLSVAHGGWSLAARVPRGARHVAYSSGLNTWLYELSTLSLRHESRPTRTLVRALRPGLRTLDRRLIRVPDRIVTNSLYSAQAIAARHRRAAEVIHPPVRTDYFTPGSGGRTHYLMVARMMAQKRVEMTIDAFRQLGLPLVVAGGGPALARMRRLAPPNVELVGAVDDSGLRDLYRASRGLVCPSVETFGIAMVEALSSGVPVIAARAGGALEIVEHGSTGILIDRVDPGAIAGAVRRLESDQPDSDACRASARPFSEAVFGEAMDTVLAAELDLSGGSGRPAAAASRSA